MSFVVEIQKFHHGEAEQRGRAHGLRNFVVLCFSGLPLPYCSCSTSGSTGSAEVNSTTSSNTSAPASGSQQDNRSQQDNINSTTSSNTSAPASGGNADFIKLTLLHYYSLTHNLSHSDLHLPIMPCYEHTITEQAVFFYIFFMNVFIYLLVYLFDASKPFFGHSMLNIYDLHI
ncbi:uncharacterized protein [Pseudorasbora parva]|uniref:uncharacterized protein isoform X3 n=1 Tax=Pseudorasbora parva TaxID=51549 RepID=UPI00351DE0CB